MTIEQFWALIAASHRQADELRALLSRLPLSEIVDFNVHFQDRMNAAFQWDLWAVAYLAAEGCSDEGFVDFRSWLISRGRDVFETAMVDAESLLQVIDAPDVEDVFFEEFQYVPAQVHAARTGGRELPPVPARPSATSGTRWHEDELAHRFPKLWAWRAAGRKSTAP